MNCQVLMVVLLIAFVSCETTTNCTSNTTDCGTTAALPNATVAYPNCTVFESIANVTCKTGYRLVGRNNNNDVFGHIQCQSNGTWNASGCEPKDCGNITAPPNAKVANHGNTLFESIANVTCNNGSRLVGRNKSDVFEYIQCQSNGTWNASSGCEPNVVQPTNDTTAENMISTSTPINSSTTILSSSPSISGGSTAPNVSSSTKENVTVTSEANVSTANSTSEHSTTSTSGLAATSTQAPFGNATANGQDGSNSTVAATTKTWDQNGCSRLEAVWFVIAILLPVATTNF